MITEDYVSFETAKLLKEKGFNEPCLMCYNSDKKIDNYGLYRSCKNSDVFALTAPSLQMACKWLREIHSLFIEISVDEMLRDKGYQWALYDNNTKEIMPYSGWENTYEESCESAIKYCLENLI